MQRKQGTLDFHITEVVNSLARDAVKFSAHDITTRLRNRVNGGDIEITGRAYTTLGGTSTQIINHSEVRDAVHALFDQGQFPQLDRTNNGQYWEYFAITATPPASAPAPATAAAPTVGHPFFRDPAPATSSGSGSFSAQRNSGSSGTVGLSGTIPHTVTGMMHTPAIDPEPTSTFPPTVSTPPAPAKPTAVDALKHNILTVDKPVIRLKLKATGQFLKINGKTRWNRRCDLSQTRSYQSRVKQFVDSGEVEIVTV